MCGRARCSLSAAEVAAEATTSQAEWVDYEHYRPSHNVCPGTYTPVVISKAAGHRTVHTMKWGLIPSFTNSEARVDHWRMFNARSEDLRERPSFKRLLAGKRCVVLFNGFYEWVKEGGSKQPYLLSLGDPGCPEEAPVMHMAGLYDAWKHANGEVLYTYTILTTRINSSLKWLHDRMPVLLPTKSAQDAWLNTTKELEPQLMATLFKPYEDKSLVWWPVTQEVNKIGFDGPDCCRKAQRAVQKHAGNIASLFQKVHSSPTAGGKGKSDLLEHCEGEEQLSSSLASALDEAPLSAESEITTSDNKAQPSSQQTPSVDNPDAVSDEWACSVCTFINAAPGATCAMCDTPQGLGASTIGSNTGMLEDSYGTGTGSLMKRPGSSLVSSNHATQIPGGGKRAKGGSSSSKGTSSNGKHVDKQQSMLSFFTKQ